MLVIAIIVLILYGKRLPEVTRNLGRMLYNLKRNFNEAKQELINLPDPSDPDSTNPDPSDPDGSSEREPGTGGSSGREPGTGGKAGEAGLKDETSKTNSKKGLLPDNKISDITSEEKSTESYNKGNTLAG